MADGPKIDPADATRTRPHRWPEASAAVPAGIGDGPRTGDRVGRYLVEGRLGAGGMGVVVLAKDPELSRQVALKVVRPGIGDRAYRDRLVREARAMAQLDHPNVVRVHDAGEADGEVFVAMEYVPGQTLGAWMKRERRPWREVVARFVHAGRGLAAAHAAGLVHRDFKPDNVLVRESDGRVAVTDFGLAAPVRDIADDGGPVTIPDPPRDTPALNAMRDLVSGDDSTIAMPPPAAVVPVPPARDAPDSPLGAAGLTATGAVIGTPAYMAPEQAGGKPIDARADVYSFCVALHEGVLGYRPFTIKPLPAGGGFARGPATPPRDARTAPAALQRAIMRGLASDPAERWPGMAPMLRALERLLARRTRVVVATTALAVLAIAGLGAYSIAGGPAVDLCPAPTERLAGVWDPARRAAIQSHLRSVDAVQGQARFDAAARAFDAYADAWSAMHVEACTATRVRGAQSDTLLDLRMRCLDRRVDQLHGAVDVLAQVDSPATLDQAIAGVIDLTPLDACADGQALSQIVPPPDAPAARTTSARLIKAADDIRAAIRAGQFNGLADRARAIVAEARSLGHAPTLGATLEALERVQRFENNILGLTATVNELVQVAAAAHDDVQAAGALIDLLLVVGRDHHTPDEAVALFPAVEAAVTRVGAPSALKASMLSTESAVLAFTPRTDEAVAKSEQAVQLATEAVTNGPPASRAARTIALLKIEYALGVAKARAGAYDEAANLFRDLIARDRELYGAGHPEEGNAWEGLGNTLGEAGQHDDAIAAFQEAVRIRTERLGETPALSKALRNLAAEFVTTARFPEAVTALQHALAILEATSTPDDPAIAVILGRLATAYEYQGLGIVAAPLRERQIAMLSRPGADREILAAAYFNRADVAREAQHFAEAFRDLERAEAIWVEVRGPDTFMLIHTQTRRGQCLLLLGRPAEAIAPLTRATALTTPGPGAYEQVLARYLLGRALVDSGRDRRGGLAKVAAARVDLINSGDNYADDVADLDAWLARTNHRGSGR